MKKIILSLGIILAIVCTANAQPGRPPRRAPHRTYRSAPAPRYWEPRFDDVGLVRLHVSGEFGIADLGGLFWHRVPKHFGAGLMAEVQTCRVFSIGVGAEYYATRTDYRYADRPYFMSLPVYANFRLSTPGVHVKLFVEARAGYAFPLNAVRTDYTVVQTRGLYTGGGLGVSFYGNNISIGLNAVDVRTPMGWTYQAPDGRVSRVITDFYLRYSYAFPMN